MFEEKRVLAVVPARSGSKGIPDKNMQKIGGVSLIGIAGNVLSELPWIDAKIISTDSLRYAEEGRKYHLDVPFIRPSSLSGDNSGAVETMQHAVSECEKLYGHNFEIVLIIEPTSPLRKAGDVLGSVELLVKMKCDSVVTVSRLLSKFHPRKLMTVREGRLDFYLEGGNDVKTRQSLGSELMWRNGVCYAITRECLMDKGQIVTDSTYPFLVTREVANIDAPCELDAARWLSVSRRATKSLTDKGGAATPTSGEDV